MDELDIISRLGQYGIATLLAIFLILQIVAQLRKGNSDANLREKLESYEAKEREAWMNMLDRTLSRVLESQFDRFQVMQNEYMGTFNASFKDLISGMERIFDNRFAEAKLTMEGAAAGRDQAFKLLSETVNGMNDNVNTLPNNVNSALVAEIAPKFDGIEAMLRALSEDLFQRFQALETKVLSGQVGVSDDVKEIRELIEALKITLEESAHVKPIVSPQQTVNNGTDHSLHNERAG